jgi:hypothetical protein
MDNPDKLATQDTGRRQAKQWTIQINWQHKTQDEDKITMDNPDKLATQDTGRRQTKQWTIFLDFPFCYCRVL